MDAINTPAAFTFAPAEPDMHTLRAECAAKVGYTPKPTAEDRAFTAACDAERKVRNWARGVVRNASGDVSEVTAAPIRELAEWYNERNPDTTVSIKQFAVLEASTPAAASVNYTPTSTPSGRNVDLSVYAAAARHMLRQSAETLVAKQLVDDMLQQRANDAQHPYPPTPRIDAYEPPALPHPPATLSIGARVDFCRPGYRFLNGVIKAFDVTGRKALVAWVDTMGWQHEALCALEFLSAARDVEGVR